MKVWSGLIQGQDETGLASVGDSVDRAVGKCEMLEADLFQDLVRGAVIDPHR